MWRYTLRRLTFLPIIIIGVSIATFIILRVLPNQDPAIILAGQNATPEQRAEITTLLGLDAPIFPITLEGSPPFVALHPTNQFFDWAGDAVRGDMGTSYITKRDVADQVWAKLPISAELILISLMVSFVIGVTFGVLSAVMRNTPLDYGVRLLAVFGQSIPDFFLLILLLIVPFILFSYAPPPGGGEFIAPWDDPWRNFRLYFPPAFVLGIGGAAGIMRLQRTTMLEVLRSDYVRTARAKGLSGRSVIIRHAFRNTLAPLVTVMGTSFTLIFGGSIIAETVMGLRGVGLFFLESALQRDFPVIQFLVLYTAVIIVLANLIVDLSYAIIDPRVRYR